MQFKIFLLLERSPLTVLVEQQWRHGLSGGVRLVVSVRGA